MLNQQLQNYKIISLLGQGGMANVYLAEHLLLGSKVAIKVLNKEFVHNDNIRKRFITEARNIYRMTHSNMVRVTDLIEEGDVVAFVMEYIEGETLKEHLERRGKLRDDELINIFSQMLEALNYVHEQQLVHRDIKPSNFMLDKNGNIKLLDFGIAKTLDANALEYTQTSTGMQMGTPMYMSPEQIAETKSVTTQSDIYSLGVVLWQMTMGKKPYDSQTISNFQLQTKIVNEPLPQTNTIWDSSIQKATHKEPSLRYKSCKIWQSEIENLMGRNNAQSEKTKIDTDSSSAYRNVKPSTNSQKAKYTANSKKEKKQKKGYFNIKTLSIGLGILLFGIILIFSLSRGGAFHGPVATIPDNEKTEIVVPTETTGETVLEKVQPIAVEPKTLPKEKKVEVEKTTPIVSLSKLKIGQKHQGGIIFYLDNSGKHGKVCTETDLGKFEWDSALDECQNLNLNGYSDWYLPTLNDLELLYNIQNDFIHSGFYWSSTESGATTAWAFTFIDGSNHNFGKRSTDYVRAVRAF
jgi:serine/threonine protein kinase